MGISESRIRIVVDWFELFGISDCLMLSSLEDHIPFNPMKPPECTGHNTQNINTQKKSGTEKSV